MTILSLRVALIICLGCFLCACSELSSSMSGSSGFTRPPLQVQQGQFFTWAMPADWKSNETGNGVDMTSPDGKLVASSVLLTGQAGQTTPWDFVVLMLSQLRA